MSTFIFVSLCIPWSVTLSLREDCRLGEYLTCSGSNKLQTPLEFSFGVRDCSIVLYAHMDDHLTEVEVEVAVLMYCLLYVKY